MNLEDMRWRVRELAGVSDTELDTTPGDIDSFLDAVQTFVLGLFPWPWLDAEFVFQLEVGQPDYTPDQLAEGWRLAKVSGVLLRDPGDYRRLRRRPPFALDQVRDPEHGRPREWALLGGRTIRLYPIPDASSYDLRVQGLLAPPKLSDPADEPALPEHAREVLPLLAAARVLRRRRTSGDVGRADDLERQAGELIETLRHEELGDHDPTHSVVGGRRMRRVPPQHGGGRW